MTLDEATKALSMHQSFASFMKEVSELREENIRAMFEASTDQIQQISGMVLAYDQLLSMADWPKLQKQHGASLQ